MLADLGARAQRLGREFGWDPRFEREQRLLQPTLEAENSVHCPREFVATTRAYRLCILEVRC